MISFSDITCLQHCAVCNSVPLSIFTDAFSLLFGGRQKKLQHEMQLQISDIRANRKGMGNGNWLDEMRNTFSWDSWLFQSMSCRGSLDYNAAQAEET